MSGLQLVNVNDEAKLIEYLKNFVDCYDDKLTMFLKVRAMIIALNDAMPDKPEDSFKENSILVSEFTEKLKTKYKVLKQNYMAKPQDPGLNIGTGHVTGAIIDLMHRFCNKGRDLTNGFGIYDNGKPKSMFQTLLLEIMLDNFATKKILEDTKKTPAGSPATTVDHFSPSPFSSVRTEILDYMQTSMQTSMQTPMLVTGMTIGNSVNDNNTPLTITRRNKEITGKIDEINSDNDKYHKVHSASKFWALFRDHYNENSNNLKGDFDANNKSFDATNTFYNQKVRNMQIIWKHVMQLKKRRHELYVHLRKKDDDKTKLPKNINHFPDGVDESKSHFNAIDVIAPPSPVVLKEFMSKMSEDIKELDFTGTAAANIKVETFMEIPKPPEDVPKDVPDLSKEDIVTEIVEILEEKIHNKNVDDPETYFQNIRKQHYLAMEILLKYKKTSTNKVTNKLLAQTLASVDDAIYFVPQINVGGQETQDVYYYKNVETYGRFDKQKVAEEFLKTSEQPTVTDVEEILKQKREKLLELLDWMATNLHVFVGHYNLLRENLEVIFKYIHNNKLKIFSESGTYTPNTNEKLIVDYLKVFIDAIKANNNDGFVALKTKVEENDVAITETGDGVNKVIVIKEKLLDIDVLLKRINENINAICIKKIKQRTNELKEKEFNNITSIVKELMCLKNKADKPQTQEQGEQEVQPPAQAQTETQTSGEQCQKVTGDLDETQKSKLLDTIYNLFKKLIESKICLDTIFEISVTTSRRREKKRDTKHTLNNNNNNKNLLKHLKLLFEYFKGNVQTYQGMGKKFEEISEEGVNFEEKGNRLGKVIIGNNIKTYRDDDYDEGKEMLFIIPISVHS